MEIVEINLSEQMKREIERRGLSDELLALMKEDFSDPDVQAFLEENKEELPRKNIIRGHAKVHEFVTEKENFKNNSSKIAKGYYPKLIARNNHIDLTYVPTEETKEYQKEKAIQSRIHSFHMPKDIARISLSDLEYTSEREVIIEKAYEFIENYIKNPHAFHEGMYLYGSFGIGKTYLMGAMVYELAKLGYESVLVHFPTFAVDMKQAIGDNSVGDKVDAVKNTEILILDDIGADSMSSWIRDDILGVILQYRMQNEKATFFTSNFSMKELERHLSITQRGEEEPLKAKRIMERVRFLSEEVYMEGPNRRY